MIAAGPLDCNATACGAENWIIQSAAYRKYFVNANCSGGIELQNVCDKCSVECFCPSATLISPCSCAASTSYPGTVDISCAGNQVNNMYPIIANIPATTPIGKLDLSGTGIGRLPGDLTKFTTMSELNLANNQVSQISSGLELTSLTLMKLDLSTTSAGLVSIEYNSLPRK